MKPSNIYEYLLNEHPGIPSILKICAPEEYLSYNHSDYENFAVLCKCMVMISGQKLFADIRSSINKLYNQDVDICGESCDALWKAFYKETHFGRNTEKTLTVQYLEYSDISSAIRLDTQSFVRPDKYHSDLIRKKIALGIDITADERAMITVQNIREQAQICLESSDILTVDATGCNTDVAVKIIQYLETSHLFPKILLITSEVNDTMYELLCYPNLHLGINTQQTSHELSEIASRIPIGRITFVTDKDKKALDAEFNNALSVWKKENRAYSKCQIRLKKSIY
ncbi:MAG: hypothetical protein E7667_01235 [Ruminococcaceae bacterium]|nr:hypothetical protein [Oscillospiraceae bacterium]